MLVIILSNLSKELISGTSRIETQPSDSPCIILPLEANNAFQSLFYILMSPLVSKESQRVLINTCVFKKLWNSSYVQIYPFNSGWPEILLFVNNAWNSSFLFENANTPGNNPGILCWCNSFELQSFSEYLWRPFCHLPDEIHALKERFILVKWR